MYEVKEGKQPQIVHSCTEVTAVEARLAPLPFAVPRRRRIPRFIANPITTVVLGAALLMDLAALPGDPWSPTHSAAGVWFRSHRNANFQGFTLSGPDAIVFKQAQGLHLRNMITEPSWGDVATIISDKPADAAVFVGLDQSSRASGFWAITTQTRGFNINAQFGSAFNEFDKREARELYINEMVSPEWAESPRLLERLRRENFSISTIVWSGYLHNAVALGVFGLLLVSLVWVPRTPGYFRERRGARRLRRGLCPRCGYPIRGLVTCPECGAAINSTLT